MTRKVSSLLVFAALLATAPGCATRREGPRFPPAVSAPTGTALIEQLGAPDAVRRDGDGKLLRWDAAVTKGMTLGLGYYVARLILSKQRMLQDRVYAEVGPDDRVRRVRVLRGSDGLGYELWPFDD